MSIEIDRVRSSCAYVSIRVKFGELISTTNNSDEKLLFENVQVDYYYNMKRGLLILVGWSKCEDEEPNGLDFGFAIGSQKQIPSSERCRDPFTFHSLH